MKIKYLVLVFSFLFMGNVFAATPVCNNGATMNYMVGNHNGVMYYTNPCKLVRLDQLDHLQMLQALQILLLEQMIH